MVALTHGAVASVDTTFVNFIADGSNVVTLKGELDLPRRTCRTGRAIG
jgi:hypothetical protein